MTRLSRILWPPVGGMIGGALMMGVLGQAAPSGSAAKQRVIQAKLVATESLLLVPPSGATKPVAELTFSTDGQSPMLRFADKTGTTRLRVGIRADGAPLLQLADTEKKTRTMMGLREKGDPYLVLLDQNEEPRASLVADYAGSNPALMLSDAQGHNRFNANLQSDGTPRLWLMGTDSKLRVALGPVSLTNEYGVKEESAPNSIVSLDETGKVLFRKP